jgi:hypothetical protein
VFLSQIKARGSKFSREGEFPEPALTAVS